MEYVPVEFQGISRFICTVRVRQLAGQMLS